MPKLITFTNTFHALACKLKWDSVAAIITVVMRSGLLLYQVIWLLKPFEGIVWPVMDRMWSDLRLGYIMMLIRIQDVLPSSLSRLHVDHSHDSLNLLTVCHCFRCLGSFVWPLFMLNATSESSDDDQQSCDNNCEVNTQQPIPLFSIIKTNWNIDMGQEDVCHQC